MPSPFATRDALLRRSVEKAFGEQFRFKALKLDTTDVNLPRVVDGSKANFDVVGIWENIAEPNFPRARGNVSDDSALRHADAYASVAVDPDLCLWLPYEGCQCIRLHDSSEWRVAFGLPDDRGRVIFFLTSKKRTG